MVELAHFPRFPYTNRADRDMVGPVITPVLRRFLVAVVLLALSIPLGIFAQVRPISKAPEVNVAAVVETPEPDDADTETEDETADDETDANTAQPTPAQVAPNVVQPPPAPAMPTPPPPRTAANPVGRPANQPTP